MGFSAGAFYAVDKPGLRTQQFLIKSVNCGLLVIILIGVPTVTGDGNTEFSSYSASGWSNGSYYLGFGGGTGGLANNQMVRNVSVKFTAGHCY